MNFISSYVSMAGDLLYLKILKRYFANEPH